LKQASVLSAGAERRPRIQRSWFSWFAD